MIHKKTGSPNVLGEKGGPPPSPSGAPKPKSRPWSEPPIELDSADVVFVRPPPAPPRAPLALMLDLDIQLDAPSSTTSWTNLELANMNANALAPPTLAGLDDALEPSLSSSGHGFRPWARLTHAHRMWAAGALLMALGATGAWAALGIARRPDPLVASAAITAGDPLERRDERIAAPNDRATPGPANSQGEATQNAPVTVPNREAPIDVAAAAVKTADPSPVPAQPAKPAPAAPTAHESETATIRGTKAKSIAPDPEGDAAKSPAGGDPGKSPDGEHTPLAKRAAVARNPANPGTEPPAIEAPVTQAPAAPPPSVAGFDASGDFDRNAAMQALRQAGDNARGCVTGAPPAGDVRVAVTFARTGSVADATVEGPLAGTPPAACIAGKFRPLRIPPFRGSSMTVRKTIMF